MSAEPPVVRAARTGSADPWLLRLTLAPIRFYQCFISPLLGHHCRFYPTCSEYTALAIRRYGIVSGIIRGAGRILRCHPFHPGGVDEP